MPRTSISTAVPAGGRAARRRGRCRGRARVRSCRCVTSPTTSPSWSTAHSARGGRRPCVAMPTRCRATPRRPVRPPAPRGPRNVGLPQPTTHPRPACSGVMPGPELVAVQRQPGLEAQRVAGAEPGRGDAGADDGVPQGGAARRGRRSRRPPRPCSRCRRRCSSAVPRRIGATRNRPHRGGLREHRRQPLGAPPGPGRRAPPAPRRVDAADRRPGRGRCSRRWASRRTRRVAVGRGRHHTMRSSSTEASASSSRWVYWARPGAILARSLVSSAAGGRAPPWPSRCTVPRWETSNTTASRRQARCSAIVPVGYSSGMSHPPNGTMRAPRRRWTCVEG